MTGASFIPLLVEELKQGNPEKIILFGSYAYGEPEENSDLDIIVVTADDYLPATNHDKMKLYHKFNQLIKKYRKSIPIDMLVYTKSTFLKLQESGSQFSKEIMSKGKILYEADIKGMA